MTESARYRILTEVRDILPEKSDVLYKVSSHSSTYRSTILSHIHFDFFDNLIAVISWQNYQSTGGAVVDFQRIKSPDPVVQTRLDDFNQRLFILML